MLPGIWKRNEKAKLVLIKKNNQEVKWSECERERERSRVILSTTNH